LIVKIRMSPGAYIAILGISFISRRAFNVSKSDRSVTLYGGYTSLLSD